MQKPVVVITGGAEGIGRAIAASLVRDHAVYLVDVNSQVLKVAEEIGCAGRVCNIADPAQVELVIAEIEKEAGRVDVLVNNAGVWIQGPLEENDVARIQTVVNVNVLGTMLVTRAVLGGMKQRGQGTIVNVSSQNGLHASADRAVYNASKWAVTGFTKCLQEEVHHQGIRVMGVYPAMVQTKIFANAGIDRDTSTGILPSDVADIVCHAIRAGAHITYPEIGIQPGGY
ncbi:MAG: SDR family oxidoreductase [Candidatus Doudnabacteria bacterium]|nr:SDR family oxidoreductase [Candidatus Doudnabacteria bacterium]